MESIAATVDSLVVPHIHSGGWAAARQEGFQRAVRLAWVDGIIPPTLVRNSGRDYLTPALVGDATGDSAAVSRGIETLVALRRVVPPRLTSFDALFVEATFLAWNGHAGSAAAWLDEALRHQYTSPPQFNPVGAISLVRSMILRAHLASAAGDESTARRWSDAVATLWSDADRRLVTRLGATRTRPRPL